MSEYIIMTDSCCDLSDEMAKELELNVVPLTVHLEGKDYPNYLDGSAISNAEFYGAIRAGKVATTSAANVGQFQDAMRAVLDTGKDIVCVCFSSALSTTYQSATIAADDLRADYPEREIYVVDSLSASLGQGLLIYLTVQQKRAGLSAKELADWVVSESPERRPLVHGGRPELSQARRPRQRDVGAARARCSRSSRSCTRPTRASSSPSARCAGARRRSTC